MIVIALRSSFLGAWNWCPWNSYLIYTLGWTSPANQKAVQGTIVHKALEILARKRLALQNRRMSFGDGELKMVLPVEIAPDHALDLAWQHYSLKDGREWTARQKEECREWMWNGLLHNDGMFSPLKRTIIAPEQFFEIALPQTWAAYDYPLADGTRLQGQLILRGTMDLVTELEPGILEYIDWKTGRRVDWATGEEKTVEKLHHDPQFLLYFYALTHLYPDAQQIMMTMYFLRDGGPQTICLEKTDLPRVEAMLKDYFLRMKNTQNPRLEKSWKCTRFCPFGKTSWAEQTWTAGEGDGQSTCDHMRGELQQIGLERLTHKYLDPQKLFQYEGGGTTQNPTK